MYRQYSPVFGRIAEPENKESRAAGAMVTAAMTTDIYSKQVFSSTNERTPKREVSS